MLHEYQIESVHPIKNCSSYKIMTRDKM